MSDWREFYACGCVGEYDRLGETPGTCPTHQAFATNITCADPVKFERELARIGKETQHAV